MCKIKNCNNATYSKDFCRLHFERIKRNGSIEPKYDLSKYHPLGGIRDEGKGRRGSLAVNVVNDIKVKAKKRGKEWNLNHLEAFNFIVGQCVYCGKIPNWPKERNGIDRVDNNKGYEIENCVSCCFTCNSAKKEHSLDEFKQWVIKVYNHLNLKV